MKKLVSSGLFLALLMASARLYAQKPLSPTIESPKYRSSFQSYSLKDKTVTTLFILEGEWHSPNWTPDGKYIVSDMGGDLYRIPVSGTDVGKPERINVSQKMMATNDHALSPDGQKIAISSITPSPEKTSRLHNGILVMNVDGSAAHEVHLGWLHGWSPDGRYLIYAQSMGGDDFDVYRINNDGGGELLMTTDKARDDCPEYSADGNWIYFCSYRSGKWNSWRMPSDGAGPNDKLAEEITNSGDTQDWFPHISPDGKWLYTISYPMDHPDHAYIGDGMKIKLLRLEDGVSAKGAELTTVRTFFGGQGSGNTGGWSPDSTKFAWTEYEAIKAQKK